jgi:hypothetical protein
MSLSSTQRARRIGVAAPDRLFLGVPQAAQVNSCVAASQFHQRLHQRILCPALRIVLDRIDEKPVKGRKHIRKQRGQTMIGRNPRCLGDQIIVFTCQCPSNSFDSLCIRHSPAQCFQLG